MPVAVLVFNQEHDTRTVFKGELAAEDRIDSPLSRVTGETHRAVETVAIRQRDRTQSQLGGALDQLFGMRASL